MKIAAIQMRSGMDIEANIIRAEDHIRAAAQAGATFIATPEMTHIVQRAPKRLLATIFDEPNDPGVTRFAALAKDLKIDLLIGSLAIKTGPQRAVNRAFLFNADGALSARYDKIHLFDVTVSRTETWKESSVYDRGDKAVIADLSEVNASAKLGLSICYDLRFAALYRHYGQSGANIIAVPSAFTRPTGAAHWQALLRVRAIETGSFIIAPAQGGQHDDGRATWGHSMIIGPWGDILSHKDDDTPGYIIADIDNDKCAEARRKIPAWNYDPKWFS